MFACLRQNPSDGAVVGRYYGIYHGAKEVIYLKNDHSLTQQLLVDDLPVYKNEGRWKIDGNYITFNNFIRAIALGSSEVVVTQTPTDNIRGLWVALDGRSEIVFDVDHDYRIVKQ